MVKDLINNSILNIKKNNIKNCKDVYNSKKNLISFSKKYEMIENETRSFLRHKMYNNKNVLKKNNQGKKILKYLFVNISKNPNKFFQIGKSKIYRPRHISDYISGMTDRYAINLYKKIK